MRPGEPGIQLLQKMSMAQVRLLGQTGSPRKEKKNKNDAGGEGGATERGS